MHEKRVEIRWSDVDAFGHVNNAVYATYLEECRDEWLDAAIGGEDAVGLRDRAASPSTSAASSVSTTTTCRRALHARAHRHLERDHARGDPDAAASSPPRPRRCSSPATGRRGGRGRSPQANATALERVRECPRSTTSSARSRSGRSSCRTGSSRPRTRRRSSHDHLPTDDFVAYHEARARGGVGLIVLEATAVHQSGLLTSHTLGGYLPEIVDGYRRVAAAVQPHGTRLFVQLLHGGREQIATPPRAPALAPSPVPSPRFRVEPRAATRGTRSRSIVAGYARAAGARRRSRPRRGRDLGGPPLPVEQFFDPGLNRREDEWRRRTPFLARGRRRGSRRRRRGSALGVRLSADSAGGAESRSSPQRKASTTSRSRSATPPPTSAPSGSSRRRRARGGIVAGATERFRGRAAADRHLAHRRRRASPTG